MAAAHPHRGPYWPCRVRTALLLALLLLNAAAVQSHPALAGEAKPRRIVSLNLCTDQLLMMLASRDHIAAVSYLARDPQVSLLAAEADGLPVSHGNAEQLIVTSPDLILTGTYTRANIPLLRELGLHVVQISPATSLEDVLDNIRTVGEAIGETERADEMIARFKAGLAELRNNMDDRRPVIAPLYANAYTSGPETLVDALIEAAGFTSIGRKLGLTGTQKLSLETLLMDKPDALLLPERRYPGDALAYDVFRHPALRALEAEIPTLTWNSADTICETPELIHVVERLRAFRNTIVEQTDSKAAARP